MMKMKMGRQQPKQILIHSQKLEQRQQRTKLKLKQLMMMILQQWIEQQKQQR